MGKNTGIVSFLAGLAAGAAALFLSDEKNRAKTEAELTKVSAKAKQLKEDFDKDPEKTVRSVAQEVEKEAKKVAKKVKKVVKTKVVIKDAPKKKSVK